MYPIKNIPRELIIHGIYLGRRRNQHECFPSGSVSRCFLVST
jgi:hypothetical protein